MEHLCCVVERMGFDYPEITQLIVTQDMSERKAKMVELGDAFIAFPGGTGTLEEISEIMSKVVLGHLDAPCIVYNLNGYYNSLRALLYHMVRMDLSSEEKLQGISFAENISDIEKILLSDQSDQGDASPSPFNPSIT